jgi:hypothetical protein
VLDFPLNIRTPLLSAWFPDGRSVLLSGQDCQGGDIFIRAVLEPVEVVTLPVTGARWFRQSVSPDGRTV